MLRAQREMTDGFHAYKSVAPLKRSLLGVGCEQIQPFPRLQKRGPIEADALGKDVDMLQKVSTLTKAWPH